MKPCSRRQPLPSQAVLHMHSPVVRWPACRDWCRTSPPGSPWRRRPRARRRPRLLREQPDESEPQAHGLQRATVLCGNCCFGGGGLLLAQRLTTASTGVVEPHERVPAWRLALNSKCKMPTIWRSSVDKDTREHASPIPIVTRCVTPPLNLECTCREPARTRSQLRPRPRARSSRAQLARTR